MYSKYEGHSGYGIFLSGVWGDTTVYIPSTDRGPDCLMNRYGIGFSGMFLLHFHPILTLLMGNIVHVLIVLYVWTDRTMSCIQFYVLSRRLVLTLSHSPILPTVPVHRVPTEWQWPLSGVHSIMMVKSAQPGEGGGVHALPLSLYPPSRGKFWCMLRL